MLKRGNKNNHENRSMTPSAKGTTAAASGQSMSTSGSIGSPMATPNRDTTFARLNELDIQGEDAGPTQGTAGRKKRGGQRAAGGDKSARGLRQFSMKVCEKVESKGRTTYNEVADELVAEFQDSSTPVAAPDQPQYDEKNIRRRVYDALNVLMAMDIISKDKKEIQWKGLPQSNTNDTEELKADRLVIRNQIDKKRAYLNELEEQYIGLQTLIQRNEQLYCSGNLPSGGVVLPFILVQTRPHATVEVEISEDMQLVHFDFNSTPFELHDDNYVLKAMNLCERPLTRGVAQRAPINGDEDSSIANMSQPQVSLPMRSTNSGRPPATPQVPGILKGRVKHEH